MRARFLRRYDAIQLYADFGRYRTIYQRGQLVEVCDPHPTNQERFDARLVTAFFRDTDVLVPV